MTMKFYKLFVVLFVLSFSVFLYGGISISSTTEMAGMGKKINTIIKIDKDRVCINSSGGDASHLVIFRGDKQLYWIIDHTNKTYQEITKQDIIKLKSKMDDAQKQMEESMKNLPEEQRAMMKNMMAGKFTKETVKKIDYKEVAKGEKINQWSCTHYAGFSDGEKVQDIWFADGKQTGFNQEDFPVLKDMEDFYKSLTEQQPALFSVSFKEFQEEFGAKGFPVKVIGFSQGKAVSTVEVTEIKQATFDAASFEIPAGYKKKEISF
jgi:hypothetical protein